MRIKQQGLFSLKTFTAPQIWRIPGVFFATLAINTLAQALALVILQVYQQIIPETAALIRANKIHFSRH